MFKIVSLSIQKTNQTSMFRRSLPLPISNLLDTQLCSVLPPQILESKFNKPLPSLFSNRLLSLDRINNQNKRKQGYRDCSVINDSAINYRFLNSRFNNYFFSTLSMMNNSDVFVYKDQLTISEINTFYSNVKRIGFSHSSTYDWVYKGDNFSLALDLLMALPKVKFDCKLSLFIIEWLTIKYMVGSNPLNKFVNDTYGDSIPLSDLPLRDEITYYQDFNHIDENNDLFDLKIGDKVYLFGHCNGYSFKPSSMSNGYNLIVTNITDQGPIFKGFRSNDDREWTYSEMMNYIKVKFEDPLSYNDLVSILTEPESRIAEYSNLSNKEIKSIFEHNIDFLKESVKALSLSQRERNQQSSIRIPDRYLNQPQMGLVTIHRLNQQALRELSTGHFNYIPKHIKHKLKSTNAMTSLNPSDLFNGYHQTKPFQIQLANTLEEFYNHCLNPDFNDKPLGLFVFGDPGTGKTHCCYEIVRLLENERHVFKKAYGETLLDIDFYSSLSNTEFETSLELVIDYLLPAIEDKDIFFIDDVNEPYSEHTLVSLALFTYAYRNNKKILITSNHNPMDINKHFIPGFNGFIQFYHVVGDDYRESTSWHHNTAITSSDQSIPGLDWTDDQQTIYNWIQLLDEQDGYAGLFVTGSFGTGKTTIIKATLDHLNKSHLWISNDNINQILPFPITLQAIANRHDIDYLVIEDVNSFRLSSNMNRLIKELLNTESLKNRMGNQINIIMTSNLNGDIVNLFKFSERFLNLRMQSRLKFFFKHISVQSTIDMRKNRSCRVSVQSNPVITNGHSFSIDLSSFFRTLSKNANQSLFQLNTSLRQDLILNARQADHIIINWNCDLDFGFLENEFFRLVDLTEDHNKLLTIIHPNPKNLKELIISLINKPFSVSDIDKQKYLSRLRNL
ncbi:hypothetical protein DID75_05310 [Candidatus Marinamargulisbacteria bacterium SCGC AG-410-N11]|nr:hypothetical protein DID75_05310 [Candidatus Marinamargulisbacteria bacterium SCGC AG-410-N11]